MSYQSLNPDKALIWRLIHRDNLPWILDNGLHCGNSTVRSPHWVSIGNRELTQKRATHPVPLPPHGMLNDYVPFYFTPFSIMLYNVVTGLSVKRQDKDGIVILVSSLHKIQELGLAFVFTDKHAYCQWAEFYTDLADLDKIDWPLLQSRDFRRDPDDLEKFERYQAEALIYRHCPLDALLGMIGYSDNTQARITRLLQEKQVNLPVHVRPDWYF